MNCFPKLEEIKSSAILSCRCCNLPHHYLSTGRFYKLWYVFDFQFFYFYLFSYYFLIDAAYSFWLQWNEFDSTLRGSSGHSNQSHQDGDLDDAAWFLLYLFCCKLFDVMNYYLMSVILMFIVWIYAVVIFILK
jgi:hypothetical protein